ncbi:MAG: NAD(P)H-binding protein, partial [Chitinophagaceae bacterium]|nr:NAD(P)H-binding protein [Chitinophagaceae bacterium]
MVITIFGATGQVGKRAVYQALAEGHTVKAFGRNVDNLIDEDLRNQNFEAIKGHVFDEADVLHAVTGSHAVLSTLGGSIDGIDKTRSLGMKNIIFQMQRAGVKRIVALGGSGVLNVEN